MAIPSTAPLKTSSRYADGDPSLRAGPGRILLWVLLGLVAFGLRLGYVLGVDQTPVVYDSLIYDQAGQALARWMGPDRWVLLSALLGWKLEVLRSFAGDLSRTVLTKGPTYPLFLSLIYLLFGHSYTAVRIAQAFLDACTGVLVGGIGRELGGKRVGIVSALLFAVYQPAILMTGRLMQEPLILFLLALLLLLLLRALRTDASGSWGRSLAAGAVLGAVTVGRPALQYLFLPLLSAFWIARASGKGRGREGAALLVGALAIVAPVVALNTVTTGRLSLNSNLPLPAERDLFFGLHPCSGGYVPDLSLPNGEGGPPDSLGDPDIPAGLTYREALSAFLLQHPLAPLRAAMRKAYLAYAVPYADWHEEYLLPRWGVALLHRVLIALGLVGIAGSLPAWRRTLMPAVLILYVAGVYAVTQVQVRYLLPALVAWAPLAGFGAVQLGRALREQLFAKGRGRVPILLAASGVVVLSSSLLSVPSLLSLDPRGDPRIAFWVACALQALALAGVVCALDRLLAGGTGRLPVRAGLLAAAGLAGLVVMEHRLDEGGVWREWKSRLSSADARVEQVFHIPESLRPLQRARLLADVQPNLSPRNLVQVTVGEGTVVRLDGAHLGGECFRRYLSEVDARWQDIYGVKQRAYHLDPARMRKWLELPLANLPRPGEVIRVFIDLPAGGSLDVYGDFVPAGETAEFDGPSLDVCGLSLKDSLFKFELEWDYRLREAHPLAGKVESRRCVGAESQAGDLSPDLGVQSGRYRILLVLDQDDGTQVVI